MKLGNMDIIYLIWLLPGLLLFYFWADRKRAKDMERFADKNLINELAATYSHKGERFKSFFMILSISLILFALMRPQWGFEWKEVRRSGLDILIAIDTSKSMLAEDVKPNRLERSKLAVKDLIKKLQGDRIGLIAFSGSAFLQSPLTVDYSGFNLSLDALDIETIPQRGTSIRSAIGTAIKSYEGGMKKYKVLVIITDGEDHEGDTDKLVQTAIKQGIKIFTIGIGTNEGELIPLTDESGSRSFLKDRDGNVVKTRLDDTILKDIALKTGGSYVKAANTEFGLDLIYEQKLSKMEKREIGSKMMKMYEERFQIPLSIALALLCIEVFISRRKKDI